MKRPFDFSDLLALIGVLLVLTGAALIYIPAALILAGLPLVWFGVDSAYRKGKVNAS